ncbi:MAG: hypothetical protein JRH11_17915 [Deltaproteobacteria bacterium]|nr:hypothetical protein [Deltaproteobacteria bacterium]
MGKLLLNSLYSFVVLTAFCVGGAATAHAECPGGRVASAATEGRCCWPGQSYDLAASACTGAPACPGGMVAQGNECVAAAQSGGAQGGGLEIMEHGAAPATGQAGHQTVPVGQAPSAYQTTPVAVPAQQQPVTYVSRPRTGFIVTGSILFGISYLIAVLTAVGSEDGLWAIPVAGPFVQMRLLSDTDTFANYGYVGLTLWGLVQAVGLTLLTLGIVLRREVPVRAGLDLDGEPGGLALNPLFNMDEHGATGGLSLGGDF